jgi:probable HAF family extracellular repeat protein
MTSPLNPAEKSTNVQIAAILIFQERRLGMGPKWFLAGFSTAAMLLSGLSAAQQARTHHLRYREIEIGTFGGPNSYYNVGLKIATNNGVIVGAANTAGTDPFAPVCLFDGACIVQHAWQWNHGTLKDLGALPGGDYSSWTNAVNSNGVTVGQSQNGNLDPLTGLPAFVATVWDHGAIRNLGTLGGAFSIAISITDSGFVMGASENGIADTSGFPGFDGVSQIRGFGWSGGEMFDLGTLGGTSTFPNNMNNSGEIVGNSATSAIPGPYGAPAQAPFLWKKGEMLNLGSLGGQFGGAAAINEQGEVVGASSLASQPFACQFYYLSPGCHAYLWSHGHMNDLGTLGGSSSAAEEINDAGEAAGFSAIAGDVFFHAFAWKHNSMIDLGTISADNYSRASGMNNKGQIVGQSWLFDGQNTTASHAFIWDGEGPMIDLNTLVANRTDLNLQEANFITDRGWIIANGHLPNGDLRAAVLIPEEDSDVDVSR